MNLILDNREHTLIESCRKYIANTKLLNVTIDIQTLDLADAIIQKNSTQKEVLYIERKTIQDLLASIKDGRYEEQSYRLVNASGMPTHNIMYIIEGFISSVSPAEKKIVLSALTSLNVFKGFSVIRTANVHETAELLVSMSDKIWRDFEKGRVPAYLQGYGSQTNSVDKQQHDGDNEVRNDDGKCEQNGHNTIEDVSTSYSSVVKKVKKENLTPYNMAEVVLCQIPGISSKTATAIMAKNPGSLLNLLKHLEEDPDYLCDILLETGRKINKNCCAKIIEYLI